MGLRGNRGGTYPGAGADVDVGGVHECANDGEEVDEGPEAANCGVEEVAGELVAFDNAHEGVDGDGEDEDAAG